MTSNGGLSRRRVPASGAASTSTSDDSNGPTTTPSSASGSMRLATSAHAGSAFEGGNKIAFDPRDLEREGEDKKQGGRAPRLTIMEEVLLLGLKDKQASSVIRFSHEGKNRPLCPVLFDSICYFIITYPICF